MHLISLNDLENGLDSHSDNRIPPPWTDQLEETQYAMSRLKKKIDELKMVHDRHLHRPTFDESSEDEVLIDNCTKDISSMFNSVHRQLQFIKSHALEGNNFMYFFSLLVYIREAGK